MNSWANGIEQQGPQPEVRSKVNCSVRRLSTISDDLDGKQSGSYDHNASLGFSYYESVCGQYTERGDFRMDRRQHCDPGLEGI